MITFIESKLNLIYFSEMAIEGYKKLYFWNQEYKIWLLVIENIGITYGNLHTNYIDNCMKR